MLKAGPKEGALQGSAKSPSEGITGAAPCETTCNAPSFGPCNAPSEGKPVKKHFFLSK